MDERIRFVAQWSLEQTSFAGLCRAFRISRTTGYKWIERYEKEGPAGLENRPPVPRSHPDRVSNEIVKLIIESRKSHCKWGPRKLRAWLQDRHSDLKFPATSTVGEILKKHGLIRPRKRRLRVPFVENPLAPYGGPNEIWCADFKGNFLHKDKTRNYPFTLMDGYSRFLLKCEGMPNQKTEPVKHQFELAFEEFGLPKRIRSDNGAPFATTRPGGLSALSVWWIKLGIIPERITPGCPQQNGRHERMHKTLKDETIKPSKESFSDQQLAFDIFRAEYNEERPHESLDDKPPSRSYALSMREYNPAIASSPEYTNDYKVRRLDKQGRIRFKNCEVHVSKMIKGEPVGIIQTADNNWEIHYGPVLLGKYIKEANRKVKFQPVR